MTFSFYAELGLLLIGADESPFAKSVRRVSPFFIYTVIVVYTTHFVNTTFDMRYI